MNQNYNNNELMKQLQSQAAKRQERERLLLLQHAMEHQQHPLLFQQPDQYYSPSFAVPYNHRTTSLYQPTSVLSPVHRATSFLEFDDSFLTPWNRNVSSIITYVHNPETERFQMQLQPGSFFNLEPHDIIQQIHDLRNSEFEVKNVNQGGDTDRKDRTERKAYKEEKDGNNLDKKEKEDDEIDYGAPTDYVDFHAMKYVYQDDRRGHKKTFSKRHGKS